MPLGHHKWLIGLLVVFLAGFWALAVADIHTPTLNLVNKMGYVVTFQGVSERGEACVIVVSVKNPANEEILHGYAGCADFEKLLHMARGEKEL